MGCGRLGRVGPPRRVAGGLRPLRGGRGQGDGEGRREGGREGHTSHGRREESGGGHGCQLHGGFTETLGRVAGMVEAAVGRSRLREPAGFWSLAKQILFATELRKGGKEHTALQTGAREHPNDLQQGRRLDIGHKCYHFLRKKTCGASPSVAKLGAGSFTFGKGARAWHKARPVPE